MGLREFGFAKGLESTGGCLRPPTLSSATRTGCPLPPRRVIARTSVPALAVERHVQNVAAAIAPTRARALRPEPSVGQGPFARLAPTSRAMASKSNASCRAEATITDRDGQFLNNCTEFTLLSQRRQGIGVDRGLIGERSTPLPFLTSDPRSTRC